MKYTRSHVKLIVIADIKSQEEITNFHSIINKNEISDKVTFLDYNNIDEHKLILMANALGCIYTSCDEDNHQLILETYYSQKPIITCTDSKFINTFVKDNITGLVVPPVSKLIAEAMDKLYFHKTTAEKMGKSGLEYIRSLNITWNKVIEKLIN
ncbi:glycosyltransferase [Bacillus megaterium]|nr:glycosyltransferase [Priestia megaterium]